MVRGRTGHRRFREFDFPFGQKWYNLDNAGCEKEPLLTEPLFTRERLSTMAVSISEKAAAEVRRIMEQQKIDPSTRLRVGVAGGALSDLDDKLPVEGFDDSQQCIEREVVRLGPLQLGDEWLADLQAPSQGSLGQPLSLS